MFLSNDETLGHMLMNVCRQRGKRADQFMEQNGLFRGQGVLLMFLSKHDGVSHSEIAEKLRISPAAATKVIKRLERGGYLQRQADAKDERLSRVFLRPEARAVISEIHDSFKFLDEITFKGFDEEDLEKFHDYLQRILENLQDD